MNMNFDEIKRRKAALEAARQRGEVRLDHVLDEIKQEWRAERGCLSDEDFATYVDGLMPQQQQVAAEEHLRRCALCQAEMTELRAALGLTPEPAPAPVERTRAGGPLAWLWQQITSTPLTVRYATAVLLGIVAWLGVSTAKEKDTLAAVLAQLGKLRQEYDTLWSALQFEEAIKPTVHLVSGEAGGITNRLRVELSPRVEDGLVREVNVSWGDAGEGWETIYDADSSERGFQVSHDYTLPAPGQTNIWQVQVAFVVPDAVARARRLTPEQLATVCRVQATADGITLLQTTMGQRTSSPAARPEQREIKWVKPDPDAEVGWKTTVVLSAPSATERVTLLVRPVTGSTFYVQPGARPLLPGRPESFVIELGGGRTLQVGETFEIVAVCSDSFLPDKWSLDMSEVPQTQIVARSVVHKAGTEARPQGSE
jgi:hypothetical protein